MVTWNIEILERTGDGSSHRVATRMKIRVHDKIDWDWTDENVREAWMDIRDVKGDILMADGGWQQFDGPFRILEL